MKKRRKFKFPYRVSKRQSRKPSFRVVWSTRFDPFTGVDRTPEYIAPMANIDAIGGLCGFLPGTIDV